jgi:hypothetical protein
MTLLLISFLFFVYLIYRELKKNRNLPIRFDAFSCIYLAVLALLAVSSIWFPMQQWRLESFLSEKSTELTGVQSVTVHCNSLFDSIFTPLVSVAGLAYIEEKKIVFEYQWCGDITEYLKHPANVSRRELFSLTIFTHESMHIRGERDEKKTECQAVQRNHMASNILGVPDLISRRNAIAYYKNNYPEHPYFTSSCAPGKELDENLADSVWQYDINKY